MATINTTIAITGITLSASGNYASPLTITATGAITSPQDNAIVGPNTQSWTVLNEGMIEALGGLSGAISLDTGSVITNTASGVITATGGTGIFLPSGGAIFNSGLINSPSSDVNAFSSVLTVRNTGTISANGTYAFGVQVGSGNVYNSGLISAYSSGGSAFAISAGNYDYGIVTNFGTIAQTGSGFGIDLHSLSSTVLNSGIIASSGGGGIGLFQGTSETIVNTGTIRAVGTESFGILTPEGSINNSGLISGSQDGIRAGGGATTIVNSGTIAQIGSGGFEGIYLGGGGTIVDSGAISADSGRAIVFAGTNASLLLLENGYKLAGPVIGSNAPGATNTLALGGSAGAPLRVNYNGLGLSHFQDVLFGTGGNNTLKVSDAEGTFPLTISGFTLPGDIVDLTGIGNNGTISNSDTVNHRITVTGSSGAITLQFDSNDAAALATVTVTPDGSGGIDVTFSSSPSEAQLTTTSDFAGDGMSDVLWQNDDAQDSGTGQTAIWLMDGVNPTAEAVVGGPPPSWHVVGTGDFYGTGDAGILWRNDNGQVAIWEMNGLNPTAENVIASPPPDWHVIATGDFNGDGMSDVLWQYEDTTSPSDPQNGNVAIWEMDGASAIATAVVATPGPDWDVIGTGDFNGDGKSDILWQYENSQNASDPQNGNVAIWEMNGLTVIASAVIAQPGPDWHVVGTGDFNGDGKADILWQYEDSQSASDPQNGTTAIWLMSGLTPTAQAVVAAPGAAWHAIGTGDYNGDGKSDILWQNTNGQAAIWEMNGLTPISEAVFASPPNSWHVIPP